MAAQNPLRAAVGRIKVSGTPGYSVAKKVESATEFYPGRLAQKGATIDGVTVGTALARPAGWIDFEESPLRDQPATLTTAYAKDAYANISWGDAFAIAASLAVGCTVSEHALLANWANGQVIGPVVPAPGGLFLGIPFTKNVAEVSTGIELPAGMIVGLNSFIEVTKNAALATIDVGLNEAVGDGETGGDANGFLDGVSCANKGIVGPIVSDATAANITLGAKLATVIKSADSPAVYGAVPKSPGHVCDGVAKTVTYTTSDSAIEGTIWLHLIHPGLTVVGQAESAASATTAAATVIASNKI